MRYSDTECELPVELRAFVDRVIIPALLERLRGQPPASLGCELQEVIAQEHTSVELLAKCA